MEIEPESNGDVTGNWAGGEVDRKGWWTDMNDWNETGSKQKIEIDRNIRAIVHTHTRGRHALSKPFDVTSRCVKQDAEIQD